MRKLLLVAVLLIIQATFAQGARFRFIDYEYFTISTSIDPTSSINEKGLDIVGEIEYVGPVYAKLGVESFSVLTGGYTDFHGGVGVNFTSGYFNKIRYYVGVREAIVWRSTGYMANFGGEAGIDYNIGEHMFVGLRSTLDKRYDQEIFGWEPELKVSGFIRLGYKWDYKK